MYSVISLVEPDYKSVTGLIDVIRKLIKVSIVLMAARRNEQIC